MQDQLDERLQAFAEGEIDHASDAFSFLWRTLTYSEDDEAAVGSRAPIVCLSPFHGTIDPNTCIAPAGIPLDGTRTEDRPNQVHPTRVVLRSHVFGKTRWFREVTSASLYFQHDPRGQGNRIECP